MSISPTAVKAPTKYSILFLISLIIAGLAGNYFKYPIFLNIDFLFGSIFAMLALQFFGLGRGIIAAAIIASYTYFLWNHPYAIIIQTAELMVVGYLYSRRKVGLVMADMLFWLIIGIPLVYLFYHVVMHIPNSSAYLTMTKQAVNGIFNALLARLIFMGYSLRTRTSLISYREIVNNLFSLFVLLPALILMMIGSRTDFAETDLRIRSFLRQEVEEKSYQLKKWIDGRDKVAVTLANMAASRTPLEMQTHLEQVIKSDDNFLRIGVLDKEATTVAFFPLIDELGKKNIGKNFADRPYYQVLKQYRKPMLSEMVMGRIGVPKPFFAVLAPLTINGDYGGSVIGILNLDKIREDLDKSTWHGVFYTLLDKNGNVIMTTRTDQKVMTPLVREKGTLHRLDNSVSQWIPTLPPNTPASERWKKSFYVAEAGIGSLSEWKLILEQPVAPFQKEIFDNYTGKFIQLFLVLMVALAISEYLSRRIITSLESLRLITLGIPTKLAKGDDDICWPETGISEAKQLIDNFKETTDSLASQSREVQQINESLEQQVALRTKELNILLENAPVGISKIVDRVQVWVNQKTSELFLYSPEEMVNQLTKVMFPSDEAYEQFAQAAYPVLSQGGIFITDQELVRKNGKRFLARCIGKAIDPLNMSQGTLWILEDVTEHRRAEQALKDSESRYRTLFTMAAEGILLMNTDGVLTEVNESFACMHGYQPQEMLGMHLKDLDTEESTQLAPERMRKIMVLRPTLNQGNFPALLQVGREVLSQAAM